MTSSAATLEAHRAPAREHRSRTFARSRVAVLLVVVAALALAARIASTATSHLRAAAILARAEGQTGLLARRYDGPVEIETRTIATSERPLRARLYKRAGRTAMPGIVLVHGVQCMGIDDDRLIHLSRSFAGAGYAVLTPEIPSLAEMRLSPESVDQIRRAVAALAREPSVRPGRVILIGASFSGGLALRAAAAPETRAQLAAVVSVGGHHDLEAVLRYLAGLEAASSLARRNPPPYPYGLQVFVRSYADRIVGAADAPVVRDALGAYLCADPARGSATASRASDDGRSVIDDLIHDRRGALSGRIARALPAMHDDIAAMSPRGHLAALGALPVFVLHGARDDVIPASEADGIARELSGDPNATVVVQHAIQHVDLRTDASAWEQFRLVQVLARILESAS